MADAAKPVGRPMKYPYTFSAKIAQFPYKFYWKNSWLARYWIYGMVVSFPLFYKVHGMGKLLIVKGYLFLFRLHKSGANNIDVKVMFEVFIGSRNEN